MVDGEDGGHEGVWRCGCVGGIVHRATVASALLAVTASIIQTKMEKKVQLPEVYEKDVTRAVAILKAAGCTHVFLFGSLASGKVREGSDIDLAIRGCPEGSFFVSVQLV